MWDIVPPDWHIVGVGDFNGDGYDDLLLRNDDGTITDWLGSQNDGFSDNSAAILAGNPNPGSSWQVVGTGDFNADGRFDVFFRNDSGAVTDWLGNTTDNFTGNWDNLHAVLPTNVAIVGIGDYNGDHIDDLLLRDSNGGVAEWLGQANGSFAANSQFANPEPGSSWQVAGTGDFNGDGLTDLLWRNADGTVTDWLGTVSGSFDGNWETFHADPGTEWHVAGVGDFNGDGRDDILWRNEDGSITDWLGQADGSFANNSPVASQPLSLDYQIAGVGDFNGDGRSDLLLQVAGGYLETWIGSPEGALWSPLQKIFHDAVGHVQDFVDIIVSSTVEEGGGGGAPQDTSGGRIMFSQLFGLQVNVDVSQLQFFSPQQEGVTATFGDAGFTLTSGAHVVAVTRSITRIGEYNVVVDGYDFVSHMLSSASAVEPGSIIVTGQASTSSTYWAFDPSLSGINLRDGSGGSGGTVTHYVTAGASAAANGFADAHVKNKGITAADRQEYQRVHDNVARLVDYADAHPGDMIDIGGGKYITLIEVMTDLIKVSWVITDDASLSGPTGAQTWPAERLLDGGSGPGSLTTFINVQTQGGIGYTQNYDNGSGLNYQIFHEIGHAIDYYSNFTQYTNEASANTTGASLQTALGIPLMSRNGVLVPPSFGYNP